MTWAAVATPKVRCAFLQCVRTMQPPKQTMRRLCTLLGRFCSPQPNRRRCSFLTPDPQPSTIVAATTTIAKITTTITVEAEGRLPSPPLKDWRAGQFFVAVPTKARLPQQQRRRRRRRPRRRPHPQESQQQRPQRRPRRTRAPRLVSAMHRYPRQLVPAFRGESQRMGLPVVSRCLSSWLRHFLWQQ